MKTNNSKEMHLERLEQIFIELYVEGSDLCYDGLTDAATSILYAMDNLKDTINNLKYSKENVDNN